LQRTIYQHRVRIVGAGDVAAKPAKHLQTCLDDRQPQKAQQSDVFGIFFVLKSASPTCRGYYYHYYTKLHLELSGAAVDGVGQQTSEDTEESSLKEQRDGVMIKRNTMQQLHGAVVGVWRIVREISEQQHTRLDHVLMCKPQTHNNTTENDLTLPYVRGGCLLGRHPALRPQHGPSAHPRQSSWSIEPL